MPPDPSPATPTQSRQRGAQPGNTNARTHGFYARLELTDKQRQLLDATDDVTSGDVVDMLRVELFRLIEVRDYDPRALAALARALWDGERTRHRITNADDKNAVRDALTAVLADVERAREARHGPR